MSLRRRAIRDGLDDYTAWTAAAWTAAMRQGRFEQAWKISDRVLARRLAAPPQALPRHEQPTWDGRPLAGRSVLVRCYHGLGDTIQFARFLPRLARVAGAVTVWAQPPLVPLLATLPCRIRLLSLTDGEPEVDYEVELEIMELPHALRITLAELPAEVPSFAIPAAPRLSDRFSLGVVAQAGPWDPSRSVPAELIARLADRPGIALFNLQPGASIPGTADASAEEVLVAAARVRALDLVLTVDTMMAHLSGALGVPTWTMLPAEADWRWMDGRADSPWYPTMRLFRQHQAGEWGPVLETVRTGLARLLGAGR